MEDQPEKTSLPKKMTRREFVNALLAGSGAGLGLAVAYPVLEFVRPPEVAESAVDAVVAARAEEIGLDGWKIFAMGPTPGILIRKPDGEYVAFIAVCTHLDCTVQYRADFGQMWCPCHNGRFDLGGRNVAGPPPRPLEALAVNIRGDEVVVTRRAS